jgi:hypothetical protein
MSSNAIFPAACGAFARTGLNCFFNEVLHGFHYHHDITALTAASWPFASERLMPASFFRLFCSAPPPSLPGRPRWCR